MRYDVWIIWLGLLYGLIPLCCSNSNDTDIEHQLETEIDTREPRSFPATNEYLIVRTNGFNKISHFKPDGTYINTDPISSWERFALK